MPLPSLPNRTFYFVRHGVTDHNRNRLVMGQIDVPLNDEGREQAVRAAACLRGVAIGAIFASPLSRAQETATIIGAALGLVVHTVDGLMERHWGVYQDRAHNLRPHNVDPEGGESQAAFMDRAIGTIAELSGAPLTPTSVLPMLIVAHNGVCRALRRHLGLGGAEGLVPNAVPLRFDPTPTGWREVAITRGRRG